MQYNFYNTWTGMVLIVLVLSACTEAPPDPTTHRTENSMQQPMDELVTVNLNIEDGGVSRTLERFVPQIRQELNIDLRIKTVPFAKKFDIQYQDLMGADPKYDIYAAWPTHLADFAPFVADLASVAENGRPQVERDLQLSDVHPAYLWTITYKDKILGTQIDGDVKLIHYRYDLANDPKEKAAFLDRFGYPLDMNSLTWEKYLDVARFFTRPENDFYGTAEVPTFFSYFYFMDRFHGMHGHLFDYDDLTPLPDKQIIVQALQHGVETFETVSPPGAKQFGLQDLEKQLWLDQRVFMITYWPDAWRMSNNPKVSQIPGKVAVAKMPGFIRQGKLVFRPDQSGGRVLLINDKSKVKQAAYKVLVFFSDKDRTQYLVNDTLSWMDPWRLSHMRPSLFAHLTPDNLHLAEIYVDVLEESTANGYPGLQIPGTGEYQQIIEYWVSEVWQGRAQIDHAIASMGKGMNAVTEKYGRQTQLTEWRRYVDKVLKPLNLYP